MGFALGGALDAPCTRIVATIGPASSSPQAIDALLAAGVDVARVNCAHGTPDSIRASIAALRERALAAAVPLAILADLAGPKLRIGRFAGGGVVLSPGDPLTLTTESVLGDVRRVSVGHADLPRELRPGDAVHLNDGLIRLRVVATSATEIATVVEAGGPLGDRKGLSAPAAGLSLPPLTEKDLEDLDAVVAAGADFVGLSFVRSEADVHGLRDEITRRGGAALVVAKIEKAPAVERIDAIAAAADAVMVARGDLGVECPIERVAVLQKSIIESCRRRGTPVITATQMLESMVESPLPTRAEATDVANAVLDGSDALMLSAETAMGHDPRGVVAMMRRIALEAEAWARTRRAAAPLDEPAAPLPDAAETAIIARAACVAAEEVGAAALVCLTTTGGTARALARHRPRPPILAVTTSAETCRRLKLVRGVIPVEAADLPVSFDDACGAVVGWLREAGALRAGERVVLTAGLPFPRQRAANTLRVETL